MFDINKYIESGVIEEYYLDILSGEDIHQLMDLQSQYPEIKAYMHEVAISNTNFFKTIQKEAPIESLLFVKNIIKENKLWTNAQLDHKTKLLPQFITISKHTPAEKIEAVVKNLQPSADYDNIFPTVLYADDQRELVLVWVKKFVPLEEHPALDESFLILEGTADCYVDDEVFHMSSGDFMRIPPESEHKVIVTSATPAKAIRCRIAI